jgi:hypothetical protein
MSELEIFKLKNEVYKLTDVIEKMLSIIEEQRTILDKNNTDIIIICKQIIEHEYKINELESKNK